jgi:hypothetical protein
MIYMEPLIQAPGPGCIKVTFHGQCTSAILEFHCSSLLSLTVDPHRVKVKLRFVAYDYLISLLDYNFHFSLVTSTS